MPDGDDNPRDEIRHLADQQIYLRHLLERRFQQSLRLGIVFSTMVLTLVVAAFTYFQQETRQAEIDRLLQNEIASQSRLLLDRAEQTEAIANAAIADLERERERLAELSITPEGGDSKHIEQRLAALDAQVTGIETVTRGNPVRQRGWQALADRKYARRGHNKAAERAAAAH